MFYHCVVAFPGEDTIWKQLTTIKAWSATGRTLWPFQAKIQFESNSQPYLATFKLANGCGLSRRRYNLKATHNLLLFRPVASAVVAFPGEDTIWKQLTTLFRRLFSSISCGLSRRRYNLKATHNNLRWCGAESGVVAFPGEDTIWKQLTTKCRCFFFLCRLWPFQAKIQFESNSQRSVQVWSVRPCCGLSRRRYNLKATHNTPSVKERISGVVAFPGEDTIWKQLTTRMLSSACARRLWPFQAKIQFESNSQQHGSSLVYIRSCGLSRRRYNLKATHNGRYCYKSILLVVAFPGEDTIWKQLTTDKQNGVFQGRLWPFQAKIQFESNSQPRPVAGMNPEVVAFPGEDTIWKQLTTGPKC